MKYTKYFTEYTNKFKIEHRCIKSSLGSEKDFRSQKEIQQKILS